jgi:hypothetical protein
MSSHIKTLKSEIDQGLRRLIREGIQDGSIAPCDPKMTTFALAGSLNWIAHWYKENRSMTPAQIADAFITVFENGLHPRGRVSNEERGSDRLAGNGTAARRRLARP